MNWLDRMAEITRFHMKLSGIAGPSPAKGDSNGAEEAQNPVRGGVAQEIKRDATKEGLPESSEAQVVPLLSRVSSISGVVTGAGNGAKAKLRTEGQPRDFLTLPTAQEFSCGAQGQSAVIGNNGEGSTLAPSPLKVHDGTTIFALELLVGDAEANAKLPTKEQIDFEMRLQHRSRPINQYRDPADDEDCA